MTWGRPNMSKQIRKVEAKDREGWEQCYQAYAEFYHIEQTADMRARVFDWLLNSDDMVGLVAVDAGTDQVVGLAHLRYFKRPLVAKMGLFLDDLFIAPELRGSGLSHQMFNEIDRIAKASDCDLIRWITADDNYTARTLYDKLATRTMWVTYDRKFDD